MFSHLLFDCVLLMLLLLTSSLKGAYVSQVGQNADLPCTYSPATTENLVPVCWGKGPCPVFECYSLVLRTDGRNVTYQTSSRYLLKRDLHKGDVTLTIKNVTLADSGTYCCRIQFPGLMNDRKSNLELIIKPAKVTPAWTPWRDITTAFPRMLTTKGPVSETRTLKTLHDKNQTEISTLATELQDMGATTRTGLYIGAGVFAGLALILISGGLILKSSSLWPTFLLQGWQIQQQRGCTQWKTSISLRKTYMKWRIHTSVTAPSTVGINPNNLWAAVTFQRHQIQPLHLGAWCCLL
ncbi:hepatitis A virus cellular receptor 2 homolog isoform X2 [Bos indicus]|nr:hepatitis A virus cellular receptor 2 isoform X1 [Bos indicus x Bos taurus]XP_027401629.1 hepatitis A virus cellular receptor 2 isoform X1 [Bos indicus x Bos taurus]XP_027401630.1 hepatitis A virus cellular receptor 2 isoform X1 [Bos indicus x Bos taurus]